MNWLKPYRATGLGSLPHQDELAALKIISEAMPHWPHWPQFPAEAEEQGFLCQYVQPLLRLGLLTVQPRKDPVFTRGTAGWDDKVVEFYEQYLAFAAGDAGAEMFFALGGPAFGGLDAFMNNFPGYFPNAEGVKGHISGPLTMGLQIKDERGRSCFYDETLRDILVKCLAVQGALEVRRLKSLGLPVVVFIDDPSLYLIGSSAYITLTGKDAAAALADIFDLLHSQGAKVGVHACAGIDWSILFDLSVDVISFDAYHYFTGMALQADGLTGYIKRGGKMAWGIVPTSEEAWHETATTIASRFADQCAELSRRGVPVELLQSSIIWTPSCGTGALPVDLAEHIYGLLQKVVQEMDK